MCQRLAPIKPQADKKTNKKKGKEWGGKGATTEGRDRLKKGSSWRLRRRP